MLRNVLDGCFFSSLCATENGAGSSPWEISWKLLWGWLLRTSVCKSEKVTNGSLWFSRAACLFSKIHCCICRLCSLDVCILIYTPTHTVSPLLHLSRLRRWAALCLMISTTGSARSPLRMNRGPLLFTPYSSMSFWVPLRSSTVKFRTTSLMPLGATSNKE